MSESKLCVFCSKDFGTGLVHENELVTSFVSRPWFRKNHCLVIPNRHVVTIGELTSDESIEIMREIGRLSQALDNGFGTGVMQKYQPLQMENGIKVNHLHFHVFPRVKDEAGLFPVPEPNDFKGFFLPTEEEIKSVVAKTARNT